jgi:ionotropic glutamate receptor
MGLIRLFVGALEFVFIFKQPNSVTKPIFDINKNFEFYSIFLVDSRNPSFVDSRLSLVNSNVIIPLHKLMAMPTKVFLVHMTASLGSTLFVLAKDAGMMSEGYAWIITDGLSSLLHHEEGKVIDSMEDVLGVRPYVPMSTGLKDFEMR